MNKKETAYKAYINEVTPNGNSRLDNIVLCGWGGEKQERHIATQVDMAFQAGWHAAFDFVKARDAEEQSDA